MQTKRTATAEGKATGARSGAGAGAFRASGAPVRRRFGMTGPGDRRVPSVTAIQGAVRHSRIVRMMRVILPALALLVIGVVMLQAFMYQADDTLKLRFARGGSPADDLKMLNPELSARFGANNPFRITAESAWRDEKAPGRVVLDAIRADVGIEGESRLSFTAARGVLDTKAARFILGGGFALVSDRGYELHTDSAVFDTRAGTVTGESEVSMSGPAGTARSDRFTILEEGERIRLEGNVRLTFMPPTPPSG